MVAQPPRTIPPAWKRGVSCEYLRQARNAGLGGAIFAGILAAYASTGAWPVTAAGGERQTVNSEQLPAGSPFTPRP